MDTFEQFVLARKDDLTLITRRTRGEYQYDDAVNEAWAISRELSSQQGVPPDLLDPALQELVLRHLRRRLGRSADHGFRRAARLDHGYGRDDEGASPPLRDRLKADDGAHPLSLLIDAETVGANAPQERLRQLRRERPDHSPAGAWALLMRRFDNRMRAVADCLLISVSHTRRCCAKVLRLAGRQSAIVFAQLDEDAPLGPWRSRRFVRVPRQLELAFGESLFGDGQSLGDPRSAMSPAQAADAGSMSPASCLRAK